jgi:hypothetical protein
MWVAAAFVEHGRRRGCNLGEWGLASQKLSDRRADTVGLEGLDIIASGPIIVIL